MIMSSWIIWTVSLTLIPKKALDILFNIHALATAIRLLFSVLPILIHLAFKGIINLAPNYCPTFFFFLTHFGIIFTLYSIELII